MPSSSRRSTRDLLRSFLSSPSYFTNPLPFSGAPSLSFSSFPCLPYRYSTRVFSGGEIYVTREAVHYERNGGGPCTGDRRISRRTAHEARSRILQNASLARTYAGLTVEAPRGGRAGTHRPLRQRGTLSGRQPPASPRIGSAHSSAGGDAPRGKRNEIERFIFTSSGPRHRAVL